MGLLCVSRSMLCVLKCLGECMCGFCNVWVRECLVFVMCG